MFDICSKEVFDLVSFNFEQQKCWQSYGENTKKLRVLRVDDSILHKITGFICVPRTPITRLLSQALSKNYKSMRNIKRVKNNGQIRFQHKNLIPLLYESCSKKNFEKACNPSFSESQ